MRRLLALLLLLPALARGDVFGFKTIAFGKGYAGPFVVRCTWADGSTRSVTSVTGTLKVYSSPPQAGSTGALLFQKTLTSVGEGTIGVNVTATDTASPGTYYAEIALSEAGVVDTFHGAVVIEGR